ncbi:acyl carrier protein [Streptomyces sp. SBT349]|uniref:acyl carrier protein n=1 Tax=Streptomyces sp. SBT349 TaxID=1580539 RepID=UPI00066BA7C6|nr:acyl carrier protein [Streptomyces sp. SBT349]
MSPTASVFQERLISLLAEQIAVEPAGLRPDQTFRELDVDSLAMVELVVAVENDLGLELPSDVEGIDADTTLAQAALALEALARSAADDKAAHAGG